MSKAVVVIVSKCIWDSRAGSWRAWDRVSESRYSSLEEAMQQGEANACEGLSVIVRPTYNEFDPLPDGSKNKFFREWRSFDGKSFEEVRFLIP